MNTHIASFRAFILASLLTPAAFALEATSLSSFEGVEEPTVRYNSSTNTFTTGDTYTNIILSDAASSAFKMTLRYNGTTWDGDGSDTTTKDRGRAEVKGLGPYQLPSETYDYITTMRVSPNWQNTSRFAHAFQLFAVTSGGSSVSYVVHMELSGTAGHGQVQFRNNGAGSTIVARQFTFTNDVYTTYKIRIKPTSSGYVRLSVNNDTLSGSNADLVTSGASAFRPKWGNYRGFNAGWTIGDTYIQHKHIQANKI